MPKSNPSITKNNLLDNLFIVFPFWFPIIYILIAFNYPSLSKYLFIATLFLFAETHFASTWLFFFDKENWTWLKNNSYNIFFIPLYVISLIFLIFLVNPSLVIIFHYLASGWHVTRQSIGILKIYRIPNKYYQKLIYIISFSSLAIGLKHPGVLADQLNYNTNIITIVSFLFYLTIIFLASTDKLNQKIKNFMPVFTGIYIYLPLLFFKNLSVATAVGVGMHWCQYLAIIWSLYLRKSKFNKNSFTKIGIYRNLIFICIYSLAMTFFALRGMPDFTSEGPNYSLIYLIPISFQLYHFYIDGFIWKFSDKHISNSVKPYIFSSK